jgi:hypothetical protein
MKNERKVGRPKKVAPEWTAVSCRGDSHAKLKKMAESRNVPMVDVLDFAVSLAQMHFASRG